MLPFALCSSYYSSQSLLYFKINQLINVCAPVILYVHMGVEARDPLQLSSHVS